MNIFRQSLLVVAVMPSLALAHAHLQASVPVANSTVAAMPAQITLHFSEATRITAVSIAREGGKEQQDLKVPTEAKAVQLIAAPKLDAGVYLLSWRGLSDDGHVIKGAVRFTVAGK